MTIAKNLKRTVVTACLTAFCALGVAGQAEARGHHHKESKGRQAAGIIYAVADTIRAVTGQPDVVVTPGVVAPVVAPVVVTPAPVVVTPVVTPGVTVAVPAGGGYNVTTYGGHTGGFNVSTYGGHPGGFNVSTHGGRPGGFNVSTHAGHRGGFNVTRDRSR